MKKAEFYARYSTDLYIDPEQITQSFIIFISVSENP